jgi:hypothetical protein
VLPVVVFHHNLLPQHLPRIAPYTELINGGYLRGRLLDLDRPVILLHGHLHSTVLEYVARCGDAGIYCLGSTKFVEGFDVLDLHFSSVGPLGFTIYRFRIGDDGQQKWSSEEISFARRAHTLNVFSSLARAIFALVSSAFSTVADLRSKYVDASGEHPKKKTVAAAVEELRWGGLVTVDEYAHGWPYWQIRRAERV